MSTPEDRLLDVDSAHRLKLENEAAMKKRFKRAVSDVRDGTLSQAAARAAHAVPESALREALKEMP
jgi:hypothetical protein